MLQKADDASRQQLTQQIEKELRAKLAAEYAEKEKEYVLKMDEKMNTYRQQLYKSIPLTGESLMKLAARGSLEGCLRDNEAGFADHYEVIQRNLNRKRYKNEKKQLEELVDFC